MNAKDTKKHSKPLILAAIFTGIAALLHLACIFFGADWYRLMGAGEQMALMAEAGEVYPTIVTLGITAILSSWSLYALSGASVILRLPFLRVVLCLISAVFLLRGVAFVLIMPMFPGNSMTFWYVTSGVCLTLGLLYALGLKQTWSNLSSGKQG